jgi:hypothetical protein
MFLTETKQLPTFKGWQPENENIWHLGEAC